jgi:hypothetical protein
MYLAYSLQHPDGCTDRRLWEGKRLNTYFARQLRLARPIRFEHQVTEIPNIVVRYITDSGNREALTIDLKDLSRRDWLAWCFRLMQQCELTQFLWGTIMKKDPNTSFGELFYQWTDGSNG